MPKKKVAETFEKRFGDLLELPAAAMKEKSAAWKSELCVEGEPLLDKVCNDNKAEHLNAVQKFSDHCSNTLRGCITCRAALDKHI